MASIKLKGDTSGEVTISAPAVAGTTTLELPATSSTLATQNALGVRNLIINGDMKIAQRGTSTSSITASNYYTVDRWKFSGQSFGTWTMSQDTDVPSGQGFVNSVKFDCTTANASLLSTSNITLQQRIEGQMLQHLKKGTSNAESVTLSFWVKSNKTGTYVAEFRDRDNTRTICQTYTISVADTWEKKIITFAGDTTGAFDNDNDQSLHLNLWLLAGSNYTSASLATSWEADTTTNRAVGQVNLADSTSNYINITGVQLEVGDTATPFEHRPYDMELARCQRYYYKTGGTIRYYKNSSNTSAEAYPLGFPVYMRVSPSVSFGTVATGALTSSYSIAGSSNQSTSVQITATGASGYARLDAQLIADSEL